MKRIPFFALALTASTFFTSCNSDKKETPAPVKTKSELLVSHDWLITGATLAIGGQSVDAFAAGFYENCEKDNYLHFVSNNSALTYTLNDNTVACSPPSTENGTWSLNADQTKLTRTPQGQAAEVYDVLELTDTALKLSAKVDFAGTPIVITETYKVK